jgi:Flp pilus assembly pilin Flp
MGIQSYPANRLPSSRLRLRHQSGQTLVEYALIIVFISVVAIGTLLAMGGQVSNVYTTINRQLNAAENGGVTSASHH